MHNFFIGDIYNKSGNENGYKLHIEFNEGTALV